MYKKLFILCLPLLTFAADEPKVPNVHVKFRALAFVAPIPDAAYQTGPKDKDRVPLLITSDFFTNEQDYHGPAEISFMHLSKDGTTTPIANSLLVDGSQVILLFIPDNKGGLRITSLQDSPTLFPWGSLRFINLTGGRAKIRYGQNEYPVPINDEKIIRPPSSHKTYANGEILTEREDGYSVGYRIRTFQEDDLRAIYFLLPGDPKEHAILLKGVEERKRDEEAISTNEKPNGNSPVNGKPKNANR
jgi:hypothetical protein